MPNRILKETICSSENVDALSIEAETFFYRLMVQCDDYGRMDGRANLLRAKCYPLRLDRVTDKHICKWVAELEGAGLIETYSVEGHPYLHFVKWDSHQQIRAKRSKFPQPPADDGKSERVISNDINGNHLQSNVPVIQSNPIQSESNDAGQKQPAAASKTTAIKERYVELLGHDASEVSWANGEATAAKFIGEHWTPDELADAYQHFKADRFWADKLLTLSYLKKQIPDYLKSKTRGPVSATNFKDYN